MNKNLLLLAIGTLSLLFHSCAQEDDLVPEPVLHCEVLTPYFGHFLMDNEQLCWNSIYPISIGGGRIDLQEIGKVQSHTAYMEFDPDAPDHSLMKRNIRIQSTFRYDDFHNLDSFFNIVEVGPQKYAQEAYEVSGWQVVYLKGEEIFTTFGADNSNAVFDILTLEKTEDTGYHDGQGNLYDFRDLTFTAKLSCTLSNSDGTTIELKDALVKGFISNLFPIE